MSESRETTGNRVREKTRRLENALDHAGIQESIERLTQRFDREDDAVARQKSLIPRLFLASAHARMFITKRWIASAPHLLDPHDETAVQEFNKQTIVMFKLAFASRIGKLLQKVKQSGNVVAIRAASDLESRLASDDLNQIKAIGGFLNTLALSLDKPT